jgi:hypothetical protein
VKPLDSFFQDDLHGLTRFFADRFLDIGLHRQLMPAVAQSHEGALEFVAVDFSFYF